MQNSFSLQVGWPETREWCASAHQTLSFVLLLSLLSNKDCIHSQLKHLLDVLAGWNTAFDIVIKHQIAGLLESLFTNSSVTVTCKRGEELVGGGGKKEQRTSEVEIGLCPEACKF